MFQSFRVSDFGNMVEFSTGGLFVTKDYPHCALARNSEEQFTGKLGFPLIASGHPYSSLACTNSMLRVLPKESAMFGL